MSDSKPRHETFRFRLVRAILTAMLEVAPFAPRPLTTDSPPAAVLPVGEPVPFLFARGLRSFTTP